MLVSDFISLVRATLEDETQFTWTDDELLSWAQLGLEDIAFRTRGYKVEKSTECLPDFNKYELDPHIIQVLNTYINGNPLTFVEWKPKTTATGTPTEYAYEGGALYLYPTPDKVYTLDLFTVATPLLPNTASDDIPLPLCTDALRSFVLHKAYEVIDQVNLSQYHYQIYANELEKHANSVKRNTAHTRTSLAEVY